MGIFNKVTVASTLAIGSAFLSFNAYAISGGGGSDNSNPAAKYGDNGGAAVVVETLPNCTIHRPTELGANHPVVVWGNGTAFPASSYGRLLNHWASWGFFVIAAKTVAAGTGQEMVGCLDAAYRDYGDNLSDQVATTGHSQGGGGAIMAGRDSRVDTTAPIQPYILMFGHEVSSHSQQNGPMLLLSGGSDNIAPIGPNQQPVFENANVPVFWATREGASHFVPFNTGGAYRGITTAWFLYQLKGDMEAGDLFTGTDCFYCTNQQWTVQIKD